MQTSVVASAARHMRRDYGSILVAQFRHGPDMDAPYTLLAGSMFREILAGKQCAIPAKIPRP